MTEDSIPTGVSRRDLLKRSVVAGGLAWAAPTILASPAAADTSIGQCTNCPTGQLYGIKFDSNDFNAPGSEQCEAISGGATCIETPPGGVASGCCLITAGLISASASNGTTTVVLQPGVQFCSAASKGANSLPNGPCSGTTVTVQPNTPTQGATTVVIQQETQSHTEIIVCHRGSPPLTNCRGT